MRRRKDNTTKCFLCMSSLVVFASLDFLRSRNEFIKVE